MIIPDLQRDETTGLWKWPVLLNDDWSGWTAEPCSVLSGRSPQSDWSLKHIFAFDLSSCWPQLQQFCLGHSDFLVLAQGYSTEQALLLAEGVNRQLREVQLPQNHYGFSHERGMTWGIAVPERDNWDLSDALAETFSLVQSAEADGRFGSINLAAKGWQTKPHDELIVCAQRDELTNLWSWHSLAAMRLELNSEPLTLLMGDIDHFKTLNCSLGHLAGDDALQAISEMLRALESEDVTAFRLSGNVFILWARGLSSERAQIMAEEINKQLREVGIYLPHAQAHVRLSLTWGIVSVTDVNVEAMLRHADGLIGAAKSNNRRGSINS